jgi:hypothetical protein
LEVKAVSGAAMLLEAITSRDEPVEFNRICFRECKEDQIRSSQSNIKGSVNLYRKSVANMVRIVQRREYQIQLVSVGNYSC